MSRLTSPPGDSDSGTSTLASGPAGTHFEAQVGAFYLLAMLSGASPRGLPGTRIDKVELQQANAGRHLDDVIIHAHDIDTGAVAVLEIQVKRSITFASSDPVFRKVVGQIVKASKRSDFLTQRYELGIATTKGSFKIDGAYQDVLTLARQVGDAAKFAAQIGLIGAANEDMRTFVATFKKHLRDEGLTDDDQTVWLLLGRLQILTFDFTALGSASHDLALERAVRVLHEDDGSRAAAFWANLIELVIDVAKSGGDITRETAMQGLAILGYRFAGERRFTTAMKVLAEASRLALNDIRNQVGSVVLTRHERVTATRTALDSGRYVEIRGETGVGKSGVLRQMAEAMQTEGQVLVLGPGRCVAGGWPAMRAQHGFGGTIHELLVELVSDGGATIFVDNLDNFSAAEKLTINDIVGEASRVPGVSVVATARLTFGIDEPNWIPGDVLARLKQTESTTIDELSEAEIEQLTTLDPSLAPLLQDSHPAREVARNLFRLARLAAQPASAATLRTEVDMAEQWWTSADGAPDGRRERARLLRDAAEQILSGEDFLDVKDQAALPIDALVASGTLRDLGRDLVAFRHDVFREWAIANALHANAVLLDKLSLDRPATSMLARGVELAARMAIERASDGVAWNGLLERLSQPGVHRSWRRAALLALVRSEAAGALLKRAEPELFGNGAALLRELLRTVMAVEVMPASKVFAAAGIDPAIIPASISVPRGRLWAPLMIWLLSIGDRVPHEAVPEVADLYTSFSVGTLGLTDFTPFTTRQIYRWLRLMEPRHAKPTPSEGTVFWAHLDGNGVQALKLNLRSGFLMFARTTPELAAEYLKAITKAEHNKEIVRSILKMRGTLAQAAPAELADLTAQALIAQPRRSRTYGHRRDEAFTFIDHEFLQASPAQGPFFELLTSSPKDGLSLVHRLVSHAVTFKSDGEDPGSNVVTLALPGGGRNFPWKQTYFWSRQCNYYSVMSALMALEAWAHSRIDAGDTLEDVLVDVLGPPDSCAAYLLVAVGLIISHWPKSLNLVVPFLGNPELLTLDHTRQVRDQIETPDIFGLRALHSEPRGNTSVAELKQQPSRQTALDGMIGSFTFSASPEQHANLIALLKEAAERLGAPEADSHLGNPEFMVRHAMNLADASNWRDMQVKLRDGSIKTAQQYVPPAAEQNHLQTLRDAAADKSSDFAMQAALSLAVDDADRLSPESRSDAMTWARRSPSGSDDGSADAADEQRMHKEAVLIAAMIAMRDGDEELRAEHGEWARTQVIETAKALNHDPVMQIRGGLRFNPSAIAYTGLIHALRHWNTQEDMRVIIGVAAAGNHAAAHGFGAAAQALEAVDARLPRAILRSAFNACIVEYRVWDQSHGDIAGREERRLVQIEATVAAEMAWLYADGPEPEWPTFPEEVAQPRRRLRFSMSEIAAPPLQEAPAPPRSEEVHHQAAALWLSQVCGLSDATARLWLINVAKAYMPWTCAANGAGLNTGDEVELPPSEWNATFFAVVARCVVGLTSEEVAKLVVRHIVALPDRNFYDVVTIFVRSIDVLYFNGDEISTQVAVDIRAAFAEHMVTTRRWSYLSGSRDLSIEIHIGPAIAVLFFNDHGPVQGSKCYLKEKAAVRTGPFLPVVTSLVKAGPSPFVAFVLLNLLEVAPQAEQLDVLVAAGSTWLSAYPDFRQFWGDQGMGRRWCLVVDSIRALTPVSIGPTAPCRSGIDDVVAALIAQGVPEASRLEEELTKL